MGKVDFGQAGSGLRQVHQGCWEKEIILII